MTAERLADSSTSALHVVLLTAPAPMGGLETVVANLAVGLAEAGLDVTLVQMITAAGNTAAALDAARSPRLTHVTLVHPARAYGRIRDDIVALLSHGNGVVLHSHGKRADLIGAMVARAMNLPHASTVHGFITNTLKQRVARRVHELILRRTDRVIAVSKPLESELAKAVSLGRVRLIPNAPPRIVRKEPHTARALLGVSETDRSRAVVGWVGRVSKEKGLDVFIDALPMLHDRDARIVVIGDGAERSSLEHRAQALGIGGRISWLGAVPDAAALFSGFDVLAVSSRTEGTPMNVLEAIDAGVPVVATAVGGLPALLEQGAGWLVPSESPAALAAALDEALSNPSEARRRAAQATVRTNSRERSMNWIGAHISLYQELVRS